MELEKLNIPATKVKQLQRAGISQVEDLRTYFPRKYIDRSAYTGIRLDSESVFLFQCNSVHTRNYRTSLIEAIGTLYGTDIPVHVVWFNQHYLQGEIESTKGQVVTVAGSVKYMPAEPLYRKPERYEISSPAVYSISGNALRIYPVYKKVPGMAEEYLQAVIQKAMELLPPAEEILPPDIVQKYSLMSHDEMIKALHNPPDQQTLDMATTRKRWDDLLYFALRIERNNRSVPNGSIYGLPSVAQMNMIRDNLPFKLTASQDVALMGAIDHIRSGKRLNALIQGDVGCGKTIVAQLLMIAFAANGYQAVMMAPTQLLAKQHYEGLCELCTPLNIPVLFVGGGGTSKEKKAAAAQLANGTAKLIVGTQALLSDSYKFQNLALVIEDEEHKYGVLQKKALTEKAAGGTHTVTMSATPIPLSLAQTIYADSLQLFTINEKPAGRKPVLTGIAANEAKALTFLKRNCGQHGYQAYVVCPMIAENKKVEGVASAEATYQLYNSALGNDNIAVALVTSRTPKNEAAEILSAFSAGLISVLVSTTIIEVGINVPNANTIVIHNAERFGLAQLHQLRGRVGRGGDDAYCSLISSDVNNPRLQAMVQHNDGFMIARMDMEQRGAGDFLGVQQSGTEKYLALALQYSSEYQMAQTAARDILDRSQMCPILEQAIADQDAKKGGEIL